MEGVAFSLLLILKPFLLLKKLFLLLSFLLFLPLCPITLHLHLFSLKPGLLLFLLNLIDSLLPLETLLVRKLLLLSDCPGSPSVNMNSCLTEQGWTTGQSSHLNVLSPFLYHGGCFLNFVLSWSKCLFYILLAAFTNSESFTISAPLIVSVIVFARSNAVGVLTFCSNRSLRR